MRKNISILRTCFTALFLMVLIFGVKVSAATVGHITVDETGNITSDALPNAAHAVQLLKDEANIEGYTLKAGYYYFDAAGKLAELKTTGPLTYFAGIDAEAKSSKALAAGKATLAEKTWSSSIKPKTGLVGSKVYKDGNAYSGYWWEGKKLFKVSGGTKGAAVTGVATGSFFDKASGTFKSLGKGIYVKKGVKTTAVVDRRYYKDGNYNDTATGWKKISKKIYYFKDGLAVTGWKTLPSYGKGKKSYKYLFNDKGVLYTNLVDYYGYKKFIGKDILIRVNRTINNTTFYLKDNKGQYTIPALTIICATPRKKGDIPIGLKYRLEKTWNKRWYVYKKTNGAPWRYYQWAVKIHGTSSLFHSSTYRKTSGASLRLDLYNQLGKKITTHCVRHQAKWAKMIYDIARYRINDKKNGRYVWRKKRIKVHIIDTKNAGPFGRVYMTKAKKGTKWDPTDPNKPK